LPVCTNIYVVAIGIDQEKVERPAVHCEPVFTGRQSVNCRCRGGAAIRDLRDARVILMRIKSRPRLKTKPWRVTIREPKRNSDLQNQLWT
jgi:hypothetical protein